MFGKIKDVLHIDQLTESLTQYLEARIELAKIEIKELIARAMAWAIVSLLLLTAISFVLIFVNMAIAQALSSWVGYPWAGPAILAIIWAIISYVSFVTLTKPEKMTFLALKITEQMMKSPDDELTSAEEKAAERPISETDAIS